MNEVKHSWCLNESLTGWESLWLPAISLAINIQVFCLEENGNEFDLNIFKLHAKNVT